MTEILFTLFRHALRSLLRLRVLYLKTLRLGPHGEPASHLTPEQLETLKHGDGRFKRLEEAKIPQPTESSCSVASVACVINAMERGKTIENQMDLLEVIRAGHWKERLSPEGWKGRRGLPLDVLGRVVPAALFHHGIKAEVEVIPFYASQSLQERVDRVRGTLDLFREKENTYLIAHFDQGAFLPLLTIPHISPVGHWNPDTMRVTMLDVDPDQPVPYEVSLTRFTEGISSHYGGLLRPYGYSHGGLVLISVKSL